MLIILTVIIVLYYTIFNYLGISATNTTPQVESAGIKFIEIFMWALFIFLILVNGLQYFFSLDIKASIKNIFAPIPEVDIKVIEDVEEQVPVPEIMIEKQVFHVPGNKYTYEDAGALCKAYGGRLASYNEIESAYSRGGEWCSYGWSQDQLGLYPTQKSTYNTLQKTPGHEHDCGRPGINGGYIKNKNVLFGANCYGYRPEITPEERDIMAVNPAYPLTPEERRFEEKVERFRKKLPKVLVAPFNHNRWSQI